MASRVLGESGCAKLARRDADNQDEGRALAANDHFLACVQVRYGNIYSLAWDIQVVGESIASVGRASQAGRSIAAE